MMQHFKFAFVSCPSQIHEVNMRWPLNHKERQKARFSMLCLMVWWVLENQKQKLWGSTTLQWPAAGNCCKTDSMVCLGKTHLLAGTLTRSSNLSTTTLATALAYEPASVDGTNTCTGGTSTNRPFRSIQAVSALAQATASDVLLT
jgi:hypothetical protein